MRDDKSLMIFYIHKSFMLLFLILFLLVKIVEFALRPFLSPYDFSNLYLLYKYKLI